MFSAALCGSKPLSHKPWRGTIINDRLHGSHGSSASWKKRDIKQASMRNVVYRPAHSWSKSQVTTGLTPGGSLLRPLPDSLLGCFWNHLRSLQLLQGSLLPATRSVHKLTLRGPSDVKKHKKSHLQDAEGISTPQPHSQHAKTCQAQLQD